ncbi:hypothetical protein DFP92_101287 [Yoonia sediminilitoris]|uniref:Uncharacterized protein n=1 Tax=Yoonia sediminilitoris TaxID=1286148 RepID=A0A2T6KQ79_9RHOB|nr:hypothetical protein C8N45_101287 [Yoonia sediminilitoris]RCW98870.1 hypothetical protein DFP92_101287 [Yoonia sediminilitoris]
MSPNISVEQLIQGDLAALLTRYGMVTGRLEILKRAGRQSGQGYLFGCSNGLSDIPAEEGGRERRFESR